MVKRVRSKCGFESRRMSPPGLRQQRKRMKKSILEETGKARSIVYEIGRRANLHESPHLRWDNQHIGITRILSPMPTSTHPAVTCHSMP